MQIFLETDRLLLRPFTAADLELLVELESDPAVMQYITGGRPTPRAELESERLPRMLDDYERYGCFGYWAALAKPAGEFIGWFEFRPHGGGSPDEVELGYRLHRTAWGQGYATEGAKALIRKGFAELGVNRIVATTMTVNRASRRVMEKVGLRFVRTFFQEWPDPIAGAEYGDVEYELRREDWVPS